ncbi:unnamed protein product (macronuclear) [Paramecium tetraurelia]|uniref:Transmembrane protein n=1 Tax=Paramecium tetraurelia TaxID=5888 RepID=A0CQH7_PARTE|nr:uncharacterized protein GSPATT00009392001 [Paramecium tetraurelia]CAK73044.1 unnamed protein product [Paramecium tetraurelia]|eukprot:XP_001440441.1 hypothetical protein (macronuclear) [Paramecium tetraurelia strain d4-2]
MKNYNSYHQYRQTTVPSEASSVKSQITIQSYLTASPKQRNQLIRSSFKVYQEMKQEIIQNQQCKLSLRFEQIHLLMASQKLFLHLQKMQAFYNKQQKQEAFQLILRLGAIDYSNSSSIFKTPQRSHSPGIVSKDIGMEKNIQNQQLIKIIQELQSQIAGKELCKIIYLIQTKVMRDSLYQIKQQIKLSQKFEKIKSILEVSSKRFALNELREKKNKSKKIEAATLLLAFKLEKFKLNLEFTFFYQLKLSQMKQQLITKQQIQLKLNGYRMGDKNENIRLLRLHQVIIKICYRFPFNQFKKNQYSFQQIELNQRNSASIQRFSLGQLSQTMSQQVSQVLEATPKNDELIIEEQEVCQQPVVVQKPKSIQKVNGKLAKQIKLYISKCEEQKQQAQQSKLEQMAKLSKKSIQDEIDQKKQKSKSQVQSRLFLVAIFVFVLIFLIRIIN